MYDAKGTRTLFVMDDQEVFVMDDQDVKDKNFEKAGLFQVYKAVDPSKAPGEAFVTTISAFEN